MAAPKRFFVENIAEEVELPISESRHARNVLRLAEGDEVTLFDGSGSEYSAVVTRADKNGVSVHVVRAQTSDREPKTDVFLLVGALKGDKTELVVQKATELGANRIGVFSSRYCAAYMNENKLQRLQKVAREAAKQCLRATVPAVEYMDFSAALASCRDYENKIFACEFAQKSETDLKKIAGSCALVVGSEGGFSQEEAEEAHAAGFAWVSLGRRILRAETAAIALTSAVMFSLGEWQ